MHLYVIQSNVTGDIKVGRSSTPEKRLAALQVGSPYLLRIVLVAPNEGKREKDIHSILLPFRIRQKNGEWFTEGAIGYLPDDIRAHTNPYFTLNPDWFKAGSLHLTD